MLTTADLLGCRTDGLDIHGSISHRMVCRMVGIWTISAYDGLVEDLAYSVLSGLLPGISTSTVRTVPAVL